jgi:hypothetical protein
LLALERLTAEGQTLIERRNAFELMRDEAADQFERHTHTSWRPRNGPHRPKSITRHHKAFIMHS